MTTLPQRQDFEPQVQRCYILRTVAFPENRYCIIRSILRTVIRCAAVNAGEATTYAPHSNRENTAEGKKPPLGGEGENATYSSSARAAVQDRMVCTAHVHWLVVAKPSSSCQVKLPRFYPQGHQSAHKREKHTPRGTTMQQQLSQYTPHAYPVSAHSLAPQPARALGALLESRPVGARLRAAGRAVRRWDAAAPVRLAIVLGWGLRREGKKVPKHEKSKHKGDGGRYE